MVNETEPNDSPRGQNTFKCNCEVQFLKNA